MVPYDQN
jgi:hypothetical protein